MTGTVAHLHALMPVMLRLQDGRQIGIDFVVDTGFTDELSLPTDAILALGLPFRYEMDATLADGSSVQLLVYATTILWNGQERVVNVWATGSRPLLGTALLDGHELVVQFAEGGLVTVEVL